jgi:hypothetical protein
MKSGDLVRLNNVGRPVTFVPDKHIHAGVTLPDLPSGTIALILDIDVEDQHDGPTMENLARVLVESFIGFVWLRDCEVIR